MRVLTRVAAIAAFCLFAGANAMAAEIDIAPFVKKAEFEDIKISPTGEYYAATVPFEDRTGLVILRRADNKVVGGFGAGKNTHVDDFRWVNLERIVISTTRKFGALDVPQYDGNLYAVDADGGDAEILVGQSVDVMTTGSHIETKKNEQVAAFMIDDLPADPNNVVISASTFGRDYASRAEVMDVRNGKRRQVARAPVRKARFYTDNAGEVRFVLGSNGDNANKLYYRTGAGAEWELINDEDSSHRIEFPIGFSEDNKTAYLDVEQAQGTDKIVAMDVVSKERKDVLQDPDSDPTAIIRKRGSAVPVGALYGVGKPRTRFFDNSSSEARLYRSLEAAFDGRVPFVTSSTADGKLALVQVFSDRQPSDFYVFNTETKQAAYLLSTSSGFDPQKTGERRSISLAARDGLELKGYLTLPAGTVTHDLPMVVLPHGGPYGEADGWYFDEDAQLLAAAGYAVLQINYRGSGGRGRAFHHDGALQWGGKMQDDVTDATQWVVKQGIADAKRICIFGGSYGGYAALMGAAKEPSLYKCAVGYVGIYDLPMMYTRGDAHESDSDVTFLNEWIGAKDEIGSASPARMADRIKIPVFLAAGGEDERAPIEQSKAMEKALKAAGGQVETLYFPTEGHGFYTLPHRTEFYTKLLAFLNKNIGGATAAPAAAAKK
jgi:dipeptidyl aminopeptidase/acylaminoacyl peptidase